MADVKIDLDGLETGRFLMLSTCHLPKESLPCCHNMCCMEDSSGFLFSVRAASFTSLDPTVAKILIAAKELGFTHVWFDCDGDVCSSLASYDW